MGEIISVKFGAERNWETVATTIKNSLKSTGTLLGDDLDLLALKAKRVYRLIREVNADRRVEYSYTLPGAARRWNAADLAAVKAVVNQAYSDGAQAMNERATLAIIDAYGHLCTSALKVCPDNA